MLWETLIESAAFWLRRSGRFLVTELLTPHRVLSTSACNGGQSETIRYLVNHQSCEGSGHHERHACMTKLGPEEYHARFAASSDFHPNRSPAWALPPT